MMPGVVRHREPVVYVKDLPISVHFKLFELLNIQDKWQHLAAELGHWDMISLSCMSQTGWRKHGSGGPARELFDDWSRFLPKVTELYGALYRTRLIHACNLLKEYVPPDMMNLLDGGYQQAQPQQGHFQGQYPGHFQGQGQHQGTFQVQHQGPLQGQQQSTYIGQSHQGQSYQGHKQQYQREIEQYPGQTPTQYYQGQTQPAQSERQHYYPEIAYGGYVSQTPTQPQSLPLQNIYQQNVMNQNTGDFPFPKPPPQPQQQPQQTSYYSTQGQGYSSVQGQGYSNTYSEGHNNLHQYCTSPVKTHNKHITGFENQVNMTGTLRPSSHILSDTYGECGSKSSNSPIQQSGPVKPGDRNVKSMAMLSALKFPYPEIQEGTNHFATHNLIGQGGFGNVYKILLRNTVFAVKVLKDFKEPEDDQDSIDSHLNELSSLFTYRHVNIVTLIGYSVFGPKTCLVYEYMANGSLEDRLQCKNGTAPLQWAQRHRILKEAACGIQYLHTAQKNSPLIHGDIKSANILLDKNLEAKISDFGQARSATGCTNTGIMTHVTQDIRKSPIYATRAYLPVDFFNSYKFSLSTDTYSFGVVMFETCTGQMALDHKRGDNGELYLRDYIREKYCRVGLEGLEKEKDQNAHDWPTNLFLQLIELGMNCTERIKKARPEMTMVLSTLQRLLGEVQIVQSHQEYGGQRLPPQGASDSSRATSLSTKPSPDSGTQSHVVTYASGPQACLDLHPPSSIDITSKSIKSFRTPVGIPDRKSDLDDQFFMGYDASKLTHSEKITEARDVGLRAEMENRMRNLTVGVNRQRNTESSNSMRQLIQYPASSGNMQGYSLIPPGSLSIELTSTPLELQKQFDELNKQKPKPLVDSAEVNLKDDKPGLNLQQTNTPQSKTLGSPALELEGEQRNIASSYPASVNEDRVESQKAQPNKYQHQDSTDSTMPESSSSSGTSKMCTTTMTTDSFEPNSVTTSCSEPLLSCSQPPSNSVTSICGSENGLSYHMKLAINKKMKVLPMGGVCEEKKYWPDDAECNDEQSETQGITLANPFEESMDNKEPVINSQQEQSGKYHKQDVKGQQENESSLETPQQIEIGSLEVSNTRAQEIVRVGKSGPIEYSPPPTPTSREASTLPGTQVFDVPSNQRAPAVVIHPPHQYVLPQPHPSLKQSCSVNPKSTIDNAESVQECFTKMSTYNFQGPDSCEIPSSELYWDGVMSMVGDGAGGIQLFESKAGSGVQMSDSSVSSDDQRRIEWSVQLMQRRQKLDS